jgi:multiple sugar transport system ATP-binding protein
MLEIDHLLDRKPGQLSGGQRQRVAIGRAIVKQPGVFLFDEPLSNLDAALRSRTRVELARLHQRMSATMVFVTHDQVEAMTMATRIVIMNHGRIEQIGSPTEIYERPETRFVAGFIGTPAMNFLPVTAEDRGGQIIARLSNGVEVATTIPSFGLAGVADLTLGVRAEHVSPGQGMDAKVDVLERLGDRTLVYAALADGASLVYDEPGNVDLRIGDAIALTIDGSRAHIFDTEGRAHHGR